MNHCDCQQDGFCQRYQRDMSGRFRQICQGINVDLGTAAAFRAQWASETGKGTDSLCQPVSSSAHSMCGNGNPFSQSAIPLLLKTDQAPGDAVVMTAAIYSLHLAHPGKYRTAVDSRYECKGVVCDWKEVFQHNPHVVPTEPNMPVLHMHYPAIHQSNDRGIHFMQGWCEFLGSALGIHIPLLTNRPHLYFNTSTPSLASDRPCWLICSGGKSDFTAKLWGQHNYQEVVNRLQGKVNFIQVGARPEDHPPLNNVINLIGKTTLRQLFDLVRYCQGVLCGVSLLMHVAAALEKPCVVIAGGREPLQWNSYSLQHYLHTVGSLPCTSLPPRERNNEACWRSRVVPLGDGTAFDRDTCQYPISGLPKCMTKIHPSLVASVVSMYNTE